MTVLSDGTCSDINYDEYSEGDETTADISDVKDSGDR